VSLGDSCPVIAPLDAIEVPVALQRDELRSRPLTAINLCDRKNNFGTFHAATLNVVDTRYLHTLPAREVRAGMGELVKNALVLGGMRLRIAGGGWRTDTNRHDAFEVPLNARRRLASGSGPSWLIPGQALPQPCVHS
jgi:hypothetical protein